MEWEFFFFDLEGTNSVRANLILLQKRMEMIELMNLWRDIFPFELFAPSQLLLYPKYVRILFFFYIATTLIAFADFSFQIYLLVNDDQMKITHLPRVLMLQIQNFVFVSIPYLSYSYCHDLILNKTLRQLFHETTEYDRAACRFKYLLISRLNVSLLGFAIIAYWIAPNQTTSVNLVGVSIIFSVAYFFPFCWAFTFNICIMEAFRMRAKQFSCELEGPLVLLSTQDPELEMLEIETLPLVEGRRGGGMELDIETTTSRIDLEDTLLSHPPNEESPSIIPLHHDTIPAPPLSISHIRYRYLQHTRACLNFSRRYGKFLFFLFFTALVFALTAVWGIYLDHTDTFSTFPFVLISLGLVSQLGLSIAAANEAGSLLCRNISNYLLLHHLKSNTNIITSSSTSIFKDTPIEVGAMEVTSADLQHKEAMLLLECMQFSKIQISFIGEFALRSKTILAILGSMIGAIIPGIILAHQRR
jgi:hypothetical protein